MDFHLFNRKEVIVVRILKINYSSLFYFSLSVWFFYSYGNTITDKKILFLVYLKQRGGRKAAFEGFLCLGNLIVDRLAFKEFIQHDCNADALVAEIRSLIEDKEYRRHMLDEYAEIRSALGGSGASAAIAKAMSDCLM